METPSSNYKKHFDEQTYRDRALKENIRDRFNQLANTRERWQKKAKYYYKEQ